MSIATRVLEEELRAEREQLSEGLAELSKRTRASVDWRARFQERPLAMLGAAIAAGVVTGAIASSASARSRDRARGDGAKTQHSSAVADEWRGVAGTLFTILSSRAAQVTEEVLRSVVEGYLDARRTEPPEESR